MILVYAKQLNATVPAALRPAIFLLLEAINEPIQASLLAILEVVMWMFLKDHQLLCLVSV